MHLMMLTEAQGKALLREACIAIPTGIEVSNSQALKGLELTFPVAIKAQVESGGRGKAGGVRRCHNAAELENAFFTIMGIEFGGAVPHSVLIEPWLNIKRELYLAITVDSQSGGFAAIYSPEGGVDVEGGAPPLKYAFGLPDQFRAYRFREILAGVEKDPKVRERVIATARRLLQCVRTHECITAEINPLVVLGDGSLIAGDAKIVLDDAAGFRNALTKDVLLKAREKEPPDVKKCADGNLMLIWLDGNIGLISGGAGMTMGAMDAIDAAGGRPACFLDVSGNPTPAGFGLAFDLLDGSPQVGGILVSMFGGGLHTDRVARTLIDILRARKSSKPVVIRLNGTRSEIASEVLTAAGYYNHATIEDAVSVIVRDVRNAT